MTRLRYLFQSNLPRLMARVLLSCAAALVASGSLFATGAQAQLFRSAPKPLDQADTGKAARDEATRGIPFDQLTPDAKARVGEVVSKPSIYRRLPVRTVDCDHDMFLFMVRHPESVVNIWELMGVSKVSVRRTGPFTVAANDGEGTKSNVELIYGTPEYHLLFCEGEYDGPLSLNKLSGRCVVVLRSHYHYGPDQQPRVTSQLDFFMQIDNAGADLLARTLHPLVGRTADANFTETNAFAGRMSEAAEKNPDGMQQVIERLNRLDPAVRERFVQVSQRASENAAQRNAARAAPAGTPHATAHPAVPEGQYQPQPAAQPGTYRAQYAPGG